MTGDVERVARLRTSDEQWRLHDERDLLQRSLEDASIEHLAGDLSDDDYDLLRARDERRLAEVEAALDSWAVTEPNGTPEPTVHARAPQDEEAHGVADLPVAPRYVRLGPLRLGRVRWRRRWWLAALGVVSLVAATLLLALDLTSTRLPGQYATGSVSLNTAQTIQRQLVQARDLAAEGKATSAMRLYGEVLTEDPREPVALAEWGWLDWRAASTAKDQTVAAEGASALEEAVKLDGKLFVAQYYLGVVLYDEGAATKAVTHFAAFLADKPTAKWLRDAASDVRAAYAAAHEPVPAGVPRS